MYSHQWGLFWFYVFKLINLRNRGRRFFQRTYSITHLEPSRSGKGKILTSSNQKFKNVGGLLWGFFVFNVNNKKRVNEITFFTRIKYEEYPPFCGYQNRKNAMRKPVGQITPRQMQKRKDKNLQWSNY